MLGTLFCTGSLKKHLKPFITYTIISFLNRFFVRFGPLSVYVRTVFLHRHVEVEHTHITYSLENARSCMLSRCMLSVIFLHRLMDFVHSQLESVYLCMLARLLPVRLCMLNMYVLNIHGLTYTKRL